MTLLAVMLVLVFALGWGLRWLERPAPSMDALRSEYYAATASWRCSQCLLPRCAWSADRCPTHARPGEWEAWTQHPDFHAWKARGAAIRARYEKRRTA